MTKRDFPETEESREPRVAELADAPHSWDPAGRNVPATKLDWTQCLPFPQVRGVEVALDPDRTDPEGLLPVSGDSCEVP